MDRPERGRLRGAFELETAGVLAAADGGGRRRFNPDLAREIHTADGRTGRTAADGGGRGGRLLDLIYCESDRSIECPGAGPSRI